MRTASTAPSASSVSLPKRRVRTTLFSSMRVNLKHAHCVIEGSIDLDSRQKQGGSRFLVLPDTLDVIVGPGLDHERLWGRSNHIRPGAIRPLALALRGHPPPRNSAQAAGKAHR